MSDGYVGLATAGFEALSAVAKELPAIKKLFSSKDDRIREAAGNLQKEIVGYCNYLERCVKHARADLDDDKDLLNTPLNEVDAKWHAKKGGWKTYLRRSPSSRVKATVRELDGFGDRLTALLICQEQEEEIVARAVIDGKQTVAYSRLVGENLPIGKILDRIESDAERFRKEAADLGTL